MWLDYSVRPGAIACLEAGVVEEARKEMEYYCCDNPAVTHSGNKFCCPYKTFSDPEFGDQLCQMHYLGQ